MPTRPLARPYPQQVFGDTPAVLGDALHDGVNLAVWQRSLPQPVTDFACMLLALGEPLAESLTLEPMPATCGCHPWRRPIGTSPGTPGLSPTSPGW